MSLYLLTSSNPVGSQASAGVTLFLCCCGDLIGSTNELSRGIRARSAWTLSDLYLRVFNNTLTASSTIRFRDNGANGNQSVTVPSLMSGQFEDTTNTDSVGVGELFATQVVAGGTGTSIQFSVLSYTLEDPTGNVHPIVATGGSESHDRGTSSPHPIGGSMADPESGIADVQYRTRVATTFSNLRIRVSANGNTNSSTFTFQINGSNGNQTVTIPASSGAGDFEDTTNVDTVAVNNLVNYLLVTGMGAHNDINVITQVMQVHADAASRATLAAGELGGLNINDVEFGSLEMRASRSLVSGPESQAQLKLREPFDFSNMFIRIAFNDLNNASLFTLRVNGADSLLEISVPGGQTGFFENTTDTVSAVVDDLVNTENDASASTSGAGVNFGTFGCLVESAPAAVEGAEIIGSRHMAQLHPRAAARASPLSYSHDNLLAVEERVFPPIRPMDQLHPRAAARAAPYSYWRDNLLAVPERVFPPIRPMAQLHPRAAPRASPLSYWIDNLLAVAERVFPPIRPMDQLHPRAALRGSPLLYWVDNLLAVEEFPPIQPMPQLHPRAAQRASPYSYWHDNLLAVEEVPPPPIRPMDQLHPRVAQRAAPYAYWIDNLLVVPEIVAITFELTYAIDVLIGSPAIGFQEKELILKRLLVKVLQLKDLIGPG